jgi:hypothetical protein
MAWLADQQAAHAAHAVTYSRGGSSASIPATSARSLWELADAGDGAMRAESRDYMIRVSDLRLNGVAITPAAGDRITESAGSATIVSEVMSPDGVGGEPPWRWTNEYQHAFRIHTKRVAES